MPAVKPARGLRPDPAVGGVRGASDGTLAVWLGVLLLVGWVVFGVGLPALVLALTLATPSADRSPEYEGTFEMGAFLLAFTATFTAVPLAVLFLAVGETVGYLTPAPLYLGPLRRVRRAARYLGRGVGHRLPG